MSAHPFAGARLSVQARTAAWIAVLLACQAVGGVLVAYSFTLGASGKASTWMYTAFWLGALVALVPLVIAATSSRIAAWQRVVAVATVGLVTTFPKILRSPSGPLFHDDYAHMRQVNGILGSGVAPEFNSRVIPSPYFPGLHHVTALVTDVLSVSAWQSALIVISVAHTLGLVAMYALARGVGLTSRGSAVAAVVYATNANWMFFHSQFSYESLGLPLAISVVAASVWVVQSARKGRAWWLLVPAAAAVAGYLVAAVHHLSALGLVALVIALAVSATITQRPRVLAPAMWAVAGAITAGAAVRLVSLSGLLADYLGSPVTDGANQLRDLAQELLGTSDSTVDSVTLFETAIIPGYERVAGFLVPIILAAAVALYVALWWRARRETSVYSLPEFNPLRPGLIAFGLFYFVSLPTLFSVDANEGGRRSWGYTMIGLAVLVGALIDTLGSRPTQVTSSIGGRLTVNVAVAALTAWVVLLVGGVATGVNAVYRFPLPVVGVSDLTASSAETQALGSWFAANVPEHTWVLADRYSSIVIAGQAGMRVPAASVAFPYWELYFSAGPPALRTMGQIYALDAEYLVVDRRMAEVAPLNGWWLGDGEPRPGEGEVSSSAAALAKFDQMPWLTPVYASENYSVYALNLERYNPFETEALLAGGAR